MYCMPLLDIFGNFSVWLLSTQPLTLFNDTKTKRVMLLSFSCVGKEIASAMDAAVSDCFACCDDMPRLDLYVVDYVP